MEPNSQQCGKLPLSLIPLLRQLPEAYPETSHTPIQALLHTLRLDINPSTVKYARQTFDQANFERYLVQALQLFVWSKSFPPNNQSVEQTISWLTHGPDHNPWTIAELTQDFTLPSTLVSSADLHQLGRLLGKGTNTSDDSEEVVTALGKSCRAIRRAFGVRTEATKLFTVRLDDDEYDDSSDSSQGHERLPGPDLRIGIGSDSIEEGEEVLAAAGAEWPFILERHPRQEAHHHKDGEEVALTTYQFKGEAFLHGVMHGEPFRRDAPKWQLIVRE